MVYLHKERFPIGSYSKLRKRKIELYRIIKQIGENAFVVDLLKHMGIDSTFNISDLYSYTSKKVKEVSSSTKLKDEFLLRRMMQSLIEN